MGVNHTRGYLDLLVLSVLARGPRHGYQVIVEMRDLSDGEFDLPQGTVYPRLHQLEASGLLSSAWERVDERRRRVYEITRAGAAALAASRAEWDRFARGVWTVVGPS